MAHKNFPGTGSHLALWVPTPHPQHLLIVRNNIWQAAWLRTPPAFLSHSPTVEAGCMLSCWDRRVVIRKWFISLGLNEDSHPRASNYPIDGRMLLPASSLLLSFSSLAIFARGLRAFFPSSRWPPRAQGGNQTRKPSRKVSWVRSANPTWLSLKTENSRWSPCLERGQLWEATCELGLKHSRDPFKGEGRARKGPDAGKSLACVSDLWVGCRESDTVDTRQLRQSWGKKTRRLWTLSLGTDPCSPTPFVHGNYVVTIPRCSPKSTRHFCNSKRIVTEMRLPSLGLTHCIPSPSWKQEEDLAKRM